MSSYEYVYCPSHITVHHKNEDGSVWCTTGDHVEIGTFTDGQEAAAECRRLGFKFFHGDTVNLRDSATDPKVGDIVGDKTKIRTHAIKPIRRRLPVYDIHYLREVVSVGNDFVTWKRVHSNELPHTCSRKRWRAWAKGAWRCDREGVAHRDPTKGL